MDLRHYLRVFSASRYIVGATVVAAVVAATLVALLPASQWSASATLQVQPAASLAGGSVRPDDVAYLDRLINTYSEIVASNDFADTVARAARLTQTPILAVKARSNTNVIAVEATTATAESAARVANLAGSELVARVRRSNDDDLRASDKAFQTRAGQLESAIAQARVRLADLRSGTPDRRARETIAQLQEQISGLRVSMSTLRNDHETQRGAQAARVGIVSPVAEATTPTAPVSRRLGLVLPLGLFFGLLAGCGLALASDNLTRRFRSAGELEAALDAPVLASIPRDRRAGEHVLFARGSREHEAVQRLRTQLLLADPAGIRRILVVSARHGEGKSTLAANLAGSIAESGRTVVLVDTDLRLPTIHRYFDEDNDAGVSDLLSRPPASGPLPWREFVRAVKPTKLSLLLAGGPVSDPPTLLASPAMTRMLDDISADVDMVVIDSPALLAVSDALVLAPMVDAVILVADSTSPPDTLRLANQQLRRVGAPPFGLVVNRADEDAGYYYYYEYYGAEA